MNKIYAIIILCICMFTTLYAQETQSAMSQYLEKNEESNLHFDSMQKEILLNAYQATLLVNQKIETNIDNPNEVIKIYSRGRKDSNTKYVEGTVMVVSQNTNIVDELVILQDLIITDNSIVVKTNMSIDAANKVGIDQTILEKISKNYHIEATLLKEEILLYINGLEEINRFYF